MKHKYKLISISLAGLFIAAALYFQFNNDPTKMTRAEYQAFLKNHKFMNTPKLTKKQLKAIPKKDRPDLAAQQNWLMTMNPETGRPEQEALIPIYELTKQLGNSVSRGTPGSVSTPWEERGPSNVAGRTRAIMYDPNDATGKKVWAAGVTGGLWYNNDISNAASPWVNVGDFWDNIAVTALCYDPNDSQIFYAGTGEGFSAQSSKGAGVWRSTDGGTTWSQMSITSSYAIVNDIAVRDENGTSVIYVANGQTYYEGQWTGVSGLYRSDNDGLWFTEVLPNANSGNLEPTRIQIASDNRIWVGTQDNAYGSGGGKVLYSDLGTNGSWTTSKSITNGGRVEIACAPNNSNYVYAVYEVSGEVGGIMYTSNKGTSWTDVSEPNDADSGIPSSDFSRGQVWYDLTIAVDPNNESTVYVGGIDLFKSTNKGSSWTQLSHWYGGWGYPEVHADQHEITFKPGSSSEILFGNDGGVYRTTNGGSSFQNKNSGYNVTQFYACAIHPTAGTNYYLAGAQDNGTQQFNSAGIDATVEVNGGDGAFCFIDQTNPNYQLASYVYNDWTRSSNGGTSFTYNIQSDQTGQFINPADYDDNLDILYSCYDDNNINRIKNITGSPSVGTISVNLGAYASHFRVSPYTTSSTTLFVGTQSGDVFKITNANTTPNSTNIGSSLPNGNISCIEIGANEDELLVTLSNYGVNSVYYTNNGGSTWSNKEGDLPNMPVRWALFNPQDRNQVILATEVGVWSCDDISVSSPNWIPSSSGLANVRVDMLQIRTSDNQVIAATHGRGLFSSDGFSCSMEITKDINNPTCGNSNGSINITVTGGSAPYDYVWSNTTSASSISGVAAGEYTVTVSDNGTCLKIETFTLTDPGNPTVTLNGTAPICGNTNGSITASISGGGNITSYLWSNNATSSSLTNIAGGNYSLTVTDENGCTGIGTTNLADLGDVTVTLSSNNPTCLNNDGNISATILGGTTPYTYIWNNGSSTSSINNLAENSYSLTILDNNLCSNQASVTLSISNPISFNITSTPNTCGLTNGSIGIQVSGGNGGYNYIWNNNATTASQNNISDGDYSVTVTDGGGCVIKASETLTPSGMITVTTNVTPTSCGLNNGAINFIVSGGTLPYTYYWSSGHTASQVNGLTALSYTITISDNNGCTQVENVTIDDSSAPGLSLNITNPSCNIDNGELETVISGGQTPFTYLWSTNETTAIINNLAQNSYQVTIYDAFGCTDNDGTTLTNSGVPSIGILGTTDATCSYSTDGTASILVFGGSSPYTYNWSNGNTTDNPNDLISGINNITVTDANQCPKSTSVSIGHLTEPSVSISTTLASCNASNGGASAIVSGGTTPYSYLWPTNETTSSINTLSADEYTVSVIDGNACVNQHNFTITEEGELIVNITTSPISCYGKQDGSAIASVDGGQSPYTYFWVFGTQTTASATGFPTGNYTVQVDDINGCSSTATITVTQPAVISLVTTATDAMCNEPIGTASVTATGGTTPYTYNWSNGMTTATITGLTPQNLDINVYDNNNCLMQGYATVVGIGGANISTLSTDVKCNGASTGSAMAIASGSSNPYTYLWNNGNTTSVNSNIPAGVYIVTITDTYSCLYFENFTLTEPAAITVSGTVTDATAGNCDGQIQTESDGGTGSLSLSWSNSTNTSTISDLCEGTYSLQVTDANNCKVSETYEVFEEAGVGINELSNLDLAIMPNPNQGNFEIIFNTNLYNSKIEVLNYKGQLVFEQQIDELNNNQKIAIDISNQANGIYFLKINHQQGIDIKKIVIN